MKPLVSIITPTYNSSNTIRMTIESVLAQTFCDFELIIVDDLSSDITADIVKEYQNKDKRIRFFQLSKKGGASMARNKAISCARGRYIAFLDADDLWKKDKLERQIEFMKDNKVAFSYTDYEYIDSNGNSLGIIKKSPKNVSYFKMLLGNSIGCLTVIYDSFVVGKLEIPKIDKRNDYALWCLALKKCKKAYKYDGVLSLYRKNANSLSSGIKFQLLKFHYQVHRKVNGFFPVVAIFFTFMNVITYIINKFLREKSY